MSDDKATTKHDPDLYKRLASPRPRAEVDASLQAFGDELYELRKKHGICDLTFVAASFTTDGEQPAAVTVGHYGNSDNALPMAAAAFRFYREQQDRAALAMAGIEDEADHG